MGGSTPNASDQEASLVNFAYGMLAGAAVGEVDSVILIRIEYEGLTQAKMLVGRDRSLNGRTSTTVRRDYPTNKTQQ